MAPSTDNELEGSKKCAEQEFTFFLKKREKRDEVSKKQTERQQAANGWCSHFTDNQLE